MRRHTIPEQTSTEMHNSFRNIVEDLNDADVPLVHKRETLYSLQDRKRVLMKEGENLCMYVKVRGKLYRFVGEPVQ